VVFLACLFAMGSDYQSACWSGSLHLWQAAASSLRRGLWTVQTLVAAVTSLSQVSPTALRLLTSLARWDRTSTSLVTVAAGSLRAGDLASAETIGPSEATGDGG
jgi:hypothetical protein